MAADAFAETNFRSRLLFCLHSLSGQEPESSSTKAQLREAELQLPLREDSEPFRPQRAGTGASPWLTLPFGKGHLRLTCSRPICECLNKAEQTEKVLIEFSYEY